MYEVHIFITQNSAEPCEHKRFYGFLLSYVKRNGEEHKSFGYGEIYGTYYETNLKAIIHALKCLKFSCKAVVHVNDNILANMIENNLPEWEKADFHKSRGHPVKYEKEWRELGKLRKGQKIIIERGKHEKMNEIKEEFNW